MVNVITAALGKLERRARYAAAVITGLIVVLAIAFPYARDLARDVMVQSGMGNPDIVIKPGYKVQVDGHETAIFGFDPCTDDPRPWKDYWIGGRPDDSLRPFTGCVVVKPGTNTVRVQFLTGGERVVETWTVEHREHDGMPATVVKRPNGDYVVPAH